MRVFVFEHVCGGGMVRQALEGSLVRQGAAILGALVEGFQRAGVGVLTTLDHRVKLELPGAQVLRAEENDSIEEVIDQLAAEADWALVVAPEFERILESWSLKLTAAGAKRLGSRPDAVALCADKLALARTLRAAGVPTPATARLDGQQAIEEAAIVKHRYGSGCEGVFVIRERSELAQLPFRRDWIVQPLVRGRTLACCFLVRGQATTALPVVELTMHVDGRVRLLGGRLPVRSEAAERATALAGRAIRCVPGLRGFVDVNVIVGEEGGQDAVLEINPRPTMCYVGLHRLCRDSLALALVDGAAPLRWDEQPVTYEIPEAPLSAAAAAAGG